MSNDTLAILGANTLYTIILIAYINSQIKSTKELLASEIKRVEDLIKSEIRRLEDKITLVRLK